ncbi:MAG: hypothetical protein IAF38_19065 [Bacteroidia bacterium]|nr:hypothetical protein [Bacteroidia bacterium]
MCSVFFSWAHNSPAKFYRPARKFSNSFGLFTNYNLHFLGREQTGHLINHSYKAKNDLALGLVYTKTFNDNSFYSIGCSYNQLNFEESYKGYFSTPLLYNELKINYRLNGVGVPLSAGFGLRSRRYYPFILKLNYTPVFFNNLNSSWGYSGDVADLNPDGYNFIKSVFDFKSIRQQVSIGLVSQLNFDYSVIMIEPQIGFMFSPEKKPDTKFTYNPITVGIRVSYEFKELFSPIVNTWRENRNNRNEEKRKKLEEKKKQLEEKLKNELNTK